MRLRWPFLGAVLLAIVAWLLLYAPAWFWHPLGYCDGTLAQIRDCRGYNSWSGIFSDIGEITLLAGLVTVPLAVLRFLHAHFECHEETCHRLGVHHVAGTPYRTCWPHHPVLSEHEKHGVPLRVIHDRHQPHT